MPGTWIAGIASDRLFRGSPNHWFKFEHDEPDAVAQRVLDELHKPSLWEIVDKLPTDGQGGPAD